MKQNLRYFFSMLLMLMCSMVGWAAKGDTYKLVTNASDLKSGDIIVIASGTNAMGSINSAKTKIDPTTATITNGIMSWKDGLGETTLEGSAGNWHLKLQGSYILIKEPWSLTASSLEFQSSKGHSWTISVGSDGNSKIECNATMSTRYLVYNKSFGSGASRNANLQIYKKLINAGLSFTADEHSLDVSTQTANIAKLLNNEHSLPITWSSSNADVATIGSDGVATINKSGETTITASFAGNMTYAKASVTLKLTTYITLDETVDNTITLQDNANILLKRTFTGGVWNTLCLPFDLSIDEIKAVFGDATKVAEFTSVDGNTLNFTVVNEIKAGKPYIFKPVNSISTWTLNGVDIKAEQPEAVTQDGIKLQGIFSPKKITEGGTVKAAYFTIRNTIIEASASASLNAFRSYLILPKTTDVSSLKTIIYNTPTAINHVDAAPTDDANAPVYNLQGQRVNGSSLTKGVYIKNGRKFVVTK